MHLHPIWLRILLFVPIISATSHQLQAQETPLPATEFTRHDTLRGKLTAFRSCYDVRFYDLSLRIDPERQYISGSNTIHFEVEEDFTTLQVDLFSNLSIDSILFRGEQLRYVRDSNATFVTFPKRQIAGTRDQFTVYYQGAPVVANNPPWDGGFVWSRDSAGNPWVGVACEGMGASAWWPNKDHLSEEPDSMRMHFEVPEALMCVSNGTLRKAENLNDGYIRFTWFVHYPINNYNVSVNIAMYDHFSDSMISGDESLQLDYYVLPDNLEKAKQHFQQVKPMMDCFEKWFGPYPFPKDGYALVETPYWGMEHQGAIAYGNNYVNNRFGFDFIIIHESGHEWFGNSLTVADHAEMWLHEGFTTYTEAIYLECTQGMQRAEDYLMMQRGYIASQEPLIGPLDVNFHRWQKGTDIYYKGTWILHTLRNVLDDDSLWHRLLYEWATRLRHQTVTTRIWVDFVNEKTGKDFSAFFDQYLRQDHLPVLVYKLQRRWGKLRIRYRWEAGAEDFAMPVNAIAGNEAFLLQPVTTGWTRQKLGKAKRQEFSVPEEKYLIRLLEE
ncbi:MAG: M1 family metallopeptidase [Bacteroidia bacterium]